VETEVEFRGITLNEIELMKISQNRKPIKEKNNTLYHIRFCNNNEETQMK
jgi:hypothetical protein